MAAYEHHACAACGNEPATVGDSCARCGLVGDCWTPEGVERLSAQRQEPLKLNRIALEPRPLRLDELIDALIRAGLHFGVSPKGSRVSVTTRPPGWGSLGYLPRLVFEREAAWELAAEVVAWEAVATSEDFGREREGDELPSGHCPDCGAPKWRTQFHREDCPSINSHRSKLMAALITPGSYVKDTDADLGPCQRCIIRQATHRDGAGYPVCGECE